MFTGLADVLSALASLVTAAAALIAAIFSYRNNMAIKVVQHATNSLTDRLVESTAVQSRAEGKLEGVAEERAQPMVPALPPPT